MTRVDMRAKLQAIVDQFVATVGYDHTPGYKPLSLSGPQHPYDDPDRQQSLLCNEMPGCYVFTAGNGTILYVGKASRDIGIRIWEHIRRKRKPGETEAFPEAEQFVKDNQPDVAAWAIVVPDAHWWLAPALEGFLTEKLLGKRAR